MTAKDVVKMATAKDAAFRPRWTDLQEIADRVDKVAEVDSQTRVVMGDMPNNKLQRGKKRLRKVVAIIASGAVFTFISGGAAVANTLDCAERRAAVAQQAKVAPEHVKMELREDPDGSSLYRPYQPFCDAEKMRIVAEQTLSANKK